MNASQHQQYSSEQIDPKEDIEFLKRFFSRVLSYWHYIILFVLAMLLIAFVYNKFATPVYAVSASVLVQEPEDANKSVTDILYGTKGSNGTSSNLENESILLKTLTLIEETLRELEMNVTYYTKSNFGKTELYADNPIKITIDDASLIIPHGATIKCKIKDKQFYSLVAENEGAMNNFMSLVGQTEPEVPFSFGDRLLPFGKFVVVGGFRFKVDLNGLQENVENIDEEINFVIHDYESLAKRYQEKINIEAFSTESSILRISIEENNPQKGVEFLNSHIQNYIENGLAEKNNIATNTINFINNQLLTIRDSLSQIEGRLEDFKKTNSTVDLSIEGNRLYSDIQEVEKQKSMLEINIKYLSNIKDYISKGDQLENIAIPSSFGITDPTLNSLIEQLVAIQLENKMMGINMSDANPLIKNNKQKIAALKSNIIENINNLQQANQMLLAELRNDIYRFSGALSSLPSAEREKINIQRTYDLSESLYMFLMEKRAEAGISKAISNVDFKMVDKATIMGTGPVKPRATLNYILAIIAGLLIPIGFIYVNDTFSDKIVSKEDLLKLTRIPFLGIIAHSKLKGEFNVSQNQNSSTAESFRNIRSNLRFLTENGQSGKVFLISSSITGEGKTFCANNLAFIFSNFGKKTLLMNVDMRKPNFYGEIGVYSEYGLSHYLADFKSREQIIQKSILDNLYVITAGTTPPNPSELLLTGKIDKLLNELKEEFDNIIIDTPPVGIISDGLELIKKANVTIIVVRHAYTSRKMISNLNQLYDQKLTKHMGIILNDVDFDKTGYTYGSTDSFSYFDDEAK